jgi:hypothetical protein
MQGVQPRNQLELSQRNEERLLQLSPALERFNYDFLDRLINRTFNQIVRAEILPPPPPELEGRELKPHYISALAMAMNTVESATIERYTAFAGQVAAVNPEALDKFDTDEALEQYARLTGVVPSLVRDQRPARFRHPDLSGGNPGRRGGPRRLPGRAPGGERRP